MKSSTSIVSYLAAKRSKLLVKLVAGARLVVLLSLLRIQHVISH